MKFLKTAALSFAVAALVLVPSAQAQAATTVAYTNASIQAQLQALIAQVQLLQQILASRGVTTPTYNWGNCYGYGYQYGCGGYYSDDNADDIDSIEVNFDGRMAQVRVEFDDDDTELYAVEAQTIRRVAELLSPVLKVSVPTLERIINEDDWNDDDEDIRSIDVEWDGDDADVVVRFRDGDTDRFTLRNVDEDEDDVIEEIADRYNEDEDDIEDIIDFEDGNDNDNDADIESIEVEWDGDDADITVEFEDGDEDNLRLNNVDEDEDEVIEYLANRYDIDEDEVEDVIDFEDANDDEDIESIEVEFDNDDAYIEVEFENGDTDNITLRNVDEDEDEVIEYLANRYDMDEDDIEDLIDFNY